MYRRRKLGTIYYFIGIIIISRFWQDSILGGFIFTISLGKYGKLKSIKFQKAFST